MNKNVKEWKTTLTGIILAIIPVLVLTGIVSADDQDILKNISSQLVEGIAIAVSSVSSLVLIFKAKDKKEK